jgi:phosphoribosylanthranilate isomerase
VSAVVEIKFCGMTRGEDVAYGAALGAAYVGAIFAGGPRHQTMEGAQRVFGAAAPPPRRVAVVSEQTPIEIAGLVYALRLHAVQLHANPTVERIEQVKKEIAAKVWAVVQLPGDALPANFAEIAAVADAVVLDARVPGGLGGSGVTLPWTQLARSLAKARGQTRIILAGGLRPENVATAIAAIEPDVVDVSSGVESAPGIKNHRRMREFVLAVTGGGAEK